MSRYSDDWLEDRLVFSLFGGGFSSSAGSSCSCGCGPIEYLEAIRLSEFVDQCSDLDELEQREADRLSSWPIELKDRIWRCRISWRRHLKAEKREFYQAKLKSAEQQREFKQFWLSRSIDQKMEFFKFPLNHIHSIFHNFDADHHQQQSQNQQQNRNQNPQNLSNPIQINEFIEFSMLILDQCLNYSLTCFDLQSEADGDRDEIALQSALEYDQINKVISLNQQFFINQNQHQHQPNTNNSTAPVHTDPAPSLASVSASSSASDPVLRRMPEFFRPNLLSKQRQTMANSDKSNHSESLSHSVAAAVSLAASACEEKSSPSTMKLFKSVPIDSRPYQMAGQKAISAFKSDRRLMRLIIFREGIKRIIKEIEEIQKKNEKEMVLNN